MHIRFHQSCVEMNNSKTQLCRHAVMEEETFHALLSCRIDGGSGGDCGSSLTDSNLQILSTSFQPFYNNSKLLLIKRDVMDALQCCFSTNNKSMAFSFSVQK